MTTEFHHGTLIFRQWDKDCVLVEDHLAFSTIEELFAFCVQPSQPKLIDRVLLDGVGDDGTKRTITLVFQSMRLDKDT